MGGGERIPGSKRRSRVRVAAAIALALVLVLPGAGASAAPPRIAGSSAPDVAPPVGPQLALTDGRLRAAVDAMSHHHPAGDGIATEGDRVQVEVLYSGGHDAALAAVKDAGGEVTGEAGTSLIEAFVPYGQLVALEHRPGIDSIRVPLDANAPLSTNPAAPGGVAPLDLATGQEIAKTNAAAWQAAGYKGGGVKVGIVDFFDDTAWNAAQAAGEVPAPAGTFCRQAGSDCDLWTALADHGEGVAEIIHEMAPEAQLYIATAITTADLQAAINYFASKGVQIVSRSLTAQYDGPGDGTGPIAQVVDSAVAQGMTWFNAAGNSAGSGPEPRLVLARPVDRRRQRRLARMGAGRRADGAALLRRPVHQRPPLERLGRQSHELRPVPVRQPGGTPCPCRAAPATRPPARCPSRS